MEYMAFDTMTKKTNIGKALIPVIIAVSLAAGILAGFMMRDRQVSPQEKKLSQILQLIDNEYVDKVDIDSLFDKSIPDILALLDPHSAYIPASELTAVNEDLDGSFSGVGISFQIVSDTVQVIEVIPGGPAEKVGLLNGDRIIKADNVNLTGPNLSSELVFKNLRGKKGTKVNLTIKRGNSPKPIKYDIIRGDIPVNSVDVCYMLGDGIGYLRVNKFARNTYEEFINAMRSLRDAGASKFIIDLRDNSGGFMDQAIRMANEFLPAGKMIVYTKGRLPQNETTAISDGGGEFQNSEITVLTNEFSASASEIFAGAIQDNDRGLVIGRRTFGKGLVQNQTELFDGSALRLTVARYYTPSGRSIQKEYQRGRDGHYDLEIVDRYNHGELFNADSVYKDKTKIFKTAIGRTVYGGGGIVPDIFVAQDTLGYSSYYINVMNDGLIQKYALRVADKYRSLAKNSKNLSQLLKILPRDNTLLENFVDYAAKNGVPARWYYINKSRNLILNQLKAFIARDLLGYQPFIEMLNKTDVTVKRAEKALRAGDSPTVIKK